MPRGRAPKKVNKAKRKATSKRIANRRAANKAKANQIAERNRDNARSGGNRGPDVRSEGMTGRDQGILAASTKTRNSKIKDLQQSVGSLDRRVEKALADGNTDLAKDLRSRQNKFVKELGYQRALNTGGGTIRGNIRTSDGKVPLTSKGFDVFQNTVDQDFIDPTRKLQNLYPDDFGRMYPITNVINKGPFAFRGIQAALGDKKRKQIPYNLEDMPGVRYPLDQGPFFGGRSRDPNFDDTRPFLPSNEPTLESAPIEDVLMQNIFAENDEDLILPNMAPFIDKETRNEVFAQDVDNLPANNFAELDEEFQRESAEFEKRKAEEPTFADNYPFEVASNKSFPSLFNLFGQNDAEGTPTGGEQQLIDALNAEGATNVQDELTSAALQSSGYNLNPNIIDQLFDQGFLTPGTNYVNNDSLLNEALASYYDSLQ